MEKESEPMKEKLQSDRRSTEKFDEKVEEWKVSQEFKTHFISQTTFLLLSMHRPHPSSNL